MAATPVAEPAWSECESVIRRFEAAWRGPTRPDLGSYVTGPDAHRGQLLAELVHVDLEFRLRAGEFARVEEYLDRFPELAAPEIVLDLITTEFAQRGRRSPVWPEEYLLRFPQLAHDLLVLLFDGGPLACTRPLGHFAGPSLGVPVIPGYQIEGELGRGGMGVVYRARQPALGRVVAVKTFTTAPEAEARGRFRREAEAIARLDHPDIVPVYEVGEWDAAGLPVPFFVMQFYPGGSLDRAPVGLGTDARAHAATVEVIARAVHHAHQRGVLHRDLKPSNVLLDDTGRPHVTDFGLASLFDPANPGSLTAVVVGTPAFMAPEQARTPSRVTTAADVYGLGAILFYLLVGRPPFEAETPLALLDQVTHTPPPRPSAFVPAVPRDLETICLKALEKDPARRYRSTEELADDLRRFLDGRPILARPAATWEHVYRWARRHPFAVGMAALAGLAAAVAVVTLAVSTIQLADKEAATAAALSRERRAREELTQSLARERRVGYLDRVTSAGRLYAMNQLPEAWRSLEACPQDLRGWEWRYLDSVRRAGPAALTGHTDLVTAAAFLPGGRLATADRAGGVRIWDPATGQTVRSWQASAQPITGLASHPSRNWVAVAGRNELVVWDADTGRVVRRLSGTGWAAFSPDGRWLASAGAGSTVRVWNVETGQIRWELVGHRQRPLSGAFAVDGRLATSAADRTVRVWDLTTGNLIGPPREREKPVSTVAFTPDGSGLLEAHPGEVVLTDAETGRPRARIETGGRAPVACGPGWAAVGRPAGVAVLWNLETGRIEQTCPGHARTILTLAVSREGRWMATGGADGAIRVWDLTRRPEVRSVPTGPGRGSLAVAADGSRLAVGPRLMGPIEESVRVLDAADGRELSRLPATGWPAFSPDSRRIAVGRPGGGISVHDAMTGSVVGTLAGSSAVVLHVTYSPDGRLLAAGDLGGGVRVWEAESGAVVGEFAVVGPVYSLAFSPDGERIVAIGRETGEIRTVRALRDPGVSTQAGGYAAAFSPDGRWVVTADRDRFLRFRDPVTGAAVRSLPAGARAVTSLAFSPDGNRLATAGEEQGVRIWDVETGRELLQLPGETGPASAVAWVGDRVVALDEAIRIWEPTPPAE